MPTEPAAAAKMLESLPAGVAFTSRLRRDAALSELPPERTKKRGRPKAKGARLPALKEMAGKAVFRRGTVTRYGVTAEVLVHTFVCLWWSVSKKRPIRVVGVRDARRPRAGRLLFHNRFGGSSRGRRRRVRGTMGSGRSDPGVEPIFGHR